LSSCVAPLRCGNAPRVIRFDRRMTERTGHSPPKTTTDEGDDGRFRVWGTLRRTAYIRPTDRRLDHDADGRPSRCLSTPMCNALNAAGTRPYDATLVLNDGRLTQDRPTDLDLRLPEDRRASRRIRLAASAGCRQVRRQTALRDLRRNPMSRSPNQRTGCRRGTRRHEDRVSTSGDAIVHRMKPTRKAPSWIALLRRSSIALWARESSPGQTPPADEDG